LPGTVNKGELGDATSGSIAVELEDFYIGPAFIKATPGATVTVHLKNTGATDHTFTSEALGVDKQLAAGASEDITVTMPSAGATEFHCHFHQSQGMQGAFYFKTGDAVGASSAPAATSSSKGGGGYN